MPSFFLPGDHRISRLVLLAGWVYWATFVWRMLIKPICIDLEHRDLEHRDLEHRLYAVPAICLVSLSAWHHYGLNLSTALMRPG
jgi:hypothetical protein